MNAETVGIVVALASPVFYAGVLWDRIKRARRDMNGIAKRERDFERIMDHRFRRVLHVLADVTEGDAHARIIRILVGE